MDVVQKVFTAAKEAATGGDVIAMAGAWLQVYKHVCTTVMLLLEGMFNFAMPCACTIGINIRHLTPLDPRIPPTLWYGVIKEIAIVVKVRCEKQPDILNGFIRFGFEKSIFSKIRDMSNWLKPTYDNCYLFLNLVARDAREGA